jgi:pre-mRNA-splicing factor SYF2
MITTIIFKQNEARKLNHKEVVEEDRRAKLPANWEKQKERLEYEEEKEKRRDEIEQGGQSYDRVRALEWTADECEAWERKRARKTNPDPGFADFEQASHRQNERLTKNIEPDMVNYERQKEELYETSLYLYHT